MGIARNSNHLASYRSAGFRYIPHAAGFSRGKSSVDAAFLLPLGRSMMLSEQAARGSRCY
jgi:hypothetical protein